MHKCFTLSHNSVNNYCNMDIIAAKVSLTQVNIEIEATAVLVNISISTKTFHALSSDVNYFCIILGCIYIHFLKIQTYYDVVIKELRLQKPLTVHEFWLEPVRYLPELSYLRVTDATEKLIRCNLTYRVFFHAVAQQLCSSDR